MVRITTFLLARRRWQPQQSSSVRAWGAVPQLRKRAPVLRAVARPAPLSLVVAFLRRLCGGNGMRTLL